MHDRETAGATVDVWVAPLDVPPPVLAALASSLGGAECARAERYRHPADARRFSAARGWLRHVLGAELGIAPPAVPVDDAAGKPRLAGGLAPCFNVSHAGELALIAVATGEVGVDVEPESAGPQGLDVLDVVCTRREAALLRRLPPAQRPHAFLGAWTAKEAYLKAIGVGLGVAPDRVHVGVLGEGGAVPVQAAGEGGPVRWWMRPLRPADGYVGAVVMEGRNWAVRLRSTAELPLVAVTGRGA